MSIPVQATATKDHPLEEDLDVAAYVRAVRRELDDLSAEEIEELTGGLEADLADALAGQDRTPVELFGRPIGYAAELRAAAGLPPRAVAGGERRESGGLTALLVTAREARDRVTTTLDRQVWWPDLRGFLIALRPFWWVLRAYVAYQWIDQSVGEAQDWVPYSELTWLLLAVLVVISVEVGRRGWADRRPWHRGLIALGNLVAALQVAAAVASVFFTPGGFPEGVLPVYAPTSASVAHRVEVVRDPPATGVYNAGYQLVNIFAYDKNGKPLTDVQLFDDRGRPLEPADQSYLGRNGEHVDLVPALGADGQQRFNVYPLRERVTDPGYDAESGEPRPIPTAARNAARPDPTQVPIVPVPSTPQP